MSPFLRVVFQDGTIWEVLPMCEWAWTVFLLGLIWAGVVYAWIRRAWPNVEGTSAV